MFLSNIFAFFYYYIYNKKIYLLKSNLFVDPLSTIDNKKLLFLTDSKKFLIVRSDIIGYCPCLKPFSTMGQISSLARFLEIVESIYRLNKFLINISYQV